MPIADQQGTRKRKQPSSTQASPVQAVKRSRQLQSNPELPVQPSRPRQRAQSASQSQRSHFIVEDWLSNMPPRRSVPDLPDVNYPASPPADEAASTASLGRSRRGESFSGSRNGSGIGPEQSKYREHLERRNSYIVATDEKIPQHIRDEAMGLWENRRSSPQMSDTAAGEVKRQLREVTNKNEATFRHQIQSKLFNGPLPTSISEKLEEEEWRYGAKLPLDPAWDLRDDYEELTSSKPDVGLHLSLRSFSQNQKAAMDHFRDAGAARYFQPVRGAGPPFFTIEFVTHQGNSGHIWKTENQAAYAASQCMSALYKLEEYIGSEAPGKGEYFLSLQMDQRVAQVSITWVKVDPNQPPKYYSDVLQQYLLANDSAIQKISSGLRNISDCFAQQYLERLSKSLDLYADKVRASRKRQQPAQELPAPKRTSKSGTYGKPPALASPCPRSSGTNEFSTMTAPAPIQRPVHHFNTKPMSPSSQSKSDSCAATFSSHP